MWPQTMRTDSRKVDCRRAITKQNVCAVLNEAAIEFDAPVGFTRDSLEYFLYVMDGCIPPKPDPPDVVLVITDDEVTLSDQPL